MPSHRLAVVGHIEWIRFARVPAVPEAGGIVHASETWEGAGGGGGVAAVQLAKLAGSSLFLSALGDDRTANEARADLATKSVELHAATRPEPTRTALTMIDDRHERTIVTLGDRLHPLEDDPLPWDRLAEVDGVLFTAGDAGVVRRARRARVLVATSRALDVLAEADVPIDAIVGSAVDPAERYDRGDLPIEPGVVVRTEGSSGGTWETTDGRTGRYAPVPPPGPIVDTYGAGDSFEAGLTYGLAIGLDVADAVVLATRCGAYAVSGRGPTGGQLRAADLD